jgi:hypothetical protein
MWQKSLVYIGVFAILWYDENIIYQKEDQDGTAGSHRDEQ